MAEDQPTTPFNNTFQLQLERILDRLRPKAGHTQGPRKPDMAQQETGTKQT